MFLYLWFCHWSVGSLLKWVHWQCHLIRLTAHNTYAVEYTVNLCKPKPSAKVDNSVDVCVVGNHFVFCWRLGRWMSIVLNNEHRPLSPNSNENWAERLSIGLWTTQFVHWLQFIWNSINVIIYLNLHSNCSKTICIVCRTKRSKVMFWHRVSRDDKNWVGQCVVGRTNLVSPGNSRATNAHAQMIFRIR